MSILTRYFRIPIFAPVCSVHILLLWKQQFRPIFPALTQSVLFLILLPPILMDFQLSPVPGAGAGWWPVWQQASDPGYKPPMIQGLPPPQFCPATTTLTETPCLHPCNFKTTQGRAWPSPFLPFENENLNICHFCPDLFPLYDLHSFTTGRLVSELTGHWDWRCHVAGLPRHVSGVQTTMAFCRKPLLLLSHHTPHFRDLNAGVLVLSSLVAA